MLLRPELAQRIHPWLPALAAAASALAGLWLLARGGWFFVPLGGATTAIGLAWLGIELNRRRLGGRAGGPGIVEVEEGAVRYWAPHLFGGELALRDVIEVRILRVNGHACWRLRSRDGQALLIPADAAGAGALADGFAALPGADLARIADGLDRVAGGEADACIVWAAPGSGPHDDGRRGGPAHDNGRFGSGGPKGVAGPDRPALGNETAGSAAAGDRTAGDRAAGDGTADDATAGNGVADGEAPGNGTSDNGSPTA